MGDPETGAATLAGCSTSGADETTVMQTSAQIDSRYYLTKPTPDPQREQSKPPTFFPYFNFVRITNTTYKDVINGK